MSKSKSYKQTARQFLCYGVVSSIALAIDMSALYYAVQNLHFNYFSAATFGFILGLIVNYTLSKVWVFKGDYRSNKLYEFSAFALIGMVGLALNDITIIALTTLGVYYLIAKLIATAVLYFWNFGIRKKYLFS